MDTIGFHYIVEAAGCRPEVIGDPERMREVLLAGAKAGKMEVRTSYFYRFTPTGVSGVVIVAESHITIHTWPEYRYVALDVYVCGTSSFPEEAIDYILKELGCTYAHVSEIKRGIRDEDVYTHTILTWDEDLKLTQV